MHRWLPSPLPNSSKFNVGRRFIEVTGTSAVCVLTSILISAIFITVRIPVANQRLADALAWPREKQPHKNKGGEEGNHHVGSKRLPAAPSMHWQFSVNSTSILSMSGKDWWLFWSSFCNTQNWLWPWPDTKLKIKPEFQFQALTHEYQAVCLSPSKPDDANHWEDRLTSCPWTFGFFSGIIDQDAKVLLFLVT